MAALLVKPRQNSSMGDPQESSVLAVTPGFDRYGSDLQLVESVKSLVAVGERVVVAGSYDGPLRELLDRAGAETRVVEFPVLRRADATAHGAIRLAALAARATPTMLRTLREVRPNVAYVNTLTLPWWIAAARMSGVRTLCHAHEAEPTVSRLVSSSMASPLLLADAVIANSHITRDTLCSAMPAITARTKVIYNGVGGPPDTPLSPRIEEPVGLVVVGRLSPRKAPHVALEALAILRSRGVEANLTLCGTPVTGQEQYEDSLRKRAARPDLAGRVTFAGYTSPVWPALARSDVFLATSTAEPFGNAVIEAQLARRPVIATAVEGHLETVLPNRTGVLVPVHDPVAIADAVEQMVRDPARTHRLIEQAHARAQSLCSVENYRAQIARAVSELKECAQ